jgi:hypothetical protein
MTFLTLSVLLTFVAPDTMPNTSVIISNGKTTLQVIGNAKIDSSLKIGSDTSFVSLNQNFRHYDEPYDSTSPYTITPTTWAKGKNLPGLRIRHPNKNLSGTKLPLNESILRDFMIFPYEYGTAIEFNGVVECWVGEWSIHRGNFFADVEGKGNGWGGVLWVGDDQDEGGIRVTARNNLGSGGNVLYGEMSNERFTGTSHGNLRLRLPDTTNTFQFVYGKRGSNNVVSEIGVNGIVLPSGNLPGNPKKGTIFFDDTDNKFKGFDGTSWKILSQ